MNYPDFPYHIFPLGDTALTVDFGSKIDETINELIIERFYQLQQHPLPGMRAIVPAYCSLTVYYDVGTLKKIIPPGAIVFNWLKNIVEERLQRPLERNIPDRRLIKIPVCYEGEMAPDIEQLAAGKNLSVEEIISLHTGRPYKVYMLGFLPGFAYLGRVHEKIAVPRKPQPQITAEGSVGIAGRQTGIYPLTSPGGWQIIGRTPVKLFDKRNEGATLLKAGDMVEFYSITKNEFEKIIATETLKNSLLLW